MKSPRQRRRRARNKNVEDGERRRELRRIRAGGRSVKQCLVPLMLFMRYQTSGSCQIKARHTLQYMLLLLKC